MNVTCIIVLYKPDAQLLNRILEAISPQVSHVILVDNSPEIPTKIKGDNHTYIPMEGNQGIAAAQNKALRYVLQQTQYQYVLFLDQDSIPPHDMVAQLTAEYQQLLTLNIAVGGVVAKAVNRQNNKEYRQSKIANTPHNHLCEVREMMSSASLIATDNFRKVGLMDSTLFIDDVDWEWCWRATSKYRLRFFMCENVTLSHCLGEGDKTLAGRSVAITSPFRIYYQFRNYLWLTRRSYVPLTWKVKQGVKYFAKMFYYPLFVAPRADYAKQILRGIIDGLRNSANH